MSKLVSADPSDGSSFRERCYDCFRPLEGCYCAAIPSVDNQTQVLILQHRRERFHPFNTARIVRKALNNSQLLVDHTRRLATRLVLRPGAGLLFPGPSATLITDLPAELRPEQLVVLDGTWDNVKTMLRDIPPLQALPRYGLAPSSPSRYRIRREPRAECLSTVEATVAALRVLEPETRGLDQLLEAFNHMVERQLAHPKSLLGDRRYLSRNRTYRNIPLSLLGNLHNVVVAYGESTCGGPGCEDGPRSPLYWVAERLGTGERFACAIHPEVPLEDSLLRHLELSREDFSHAFSLAEAQSAWRAFQRSTDVLAVYNSSTAHLLAQLSTLPAPCLVLKSVDFNPERRYSRLDELVDGERLASAPPQHLGRAGRRLANAVALVRHLNALGNAIKSKKSA